MSLSTVLFLSIAVSLVTTILVVRFAHLHQHVTGDHDLAGVQKFHVRAVPRIGGLGLFLGLICAFCVRFYQSPELENLGLVLVLAAIPAFVCGFIEDVTKRIGVMVRLLATAASAGMAGYLLGAWLSSVEIYPIDELMAAYPFFAVALTCFGVAGVANAFNIIDGYNGLSAMVGVIILAGLAYVAFQLRDFGIVIAAVSMMGAILGFLVFNYPRGLIFLGDGGAYLVGFWVAELSVLLTERHSEVSKWFPLLLCAYPIVETMFTVYRRMVINGTHPGKPDAAHLHQMIYKRVVRWSVGSKDSSEIVTRNSLTAPYLWIMTSLAVIPAILFWENTGALMVFVLIFVVFYVLLYRRLVLFKTPKWMTLNRRR